MLHQSAFHTTSDKHVKLEAVVFKIFNDEEQLKL
jgi:hypothetical protein